jgi:hypothetical protein
MKLQRIDQAAGPVTRLEEIADVLGVDALVRALAAGVPVFDTGRVLMADLSAVQLLVEARAPSTRASPDEAP